MFLLQNADISLFLLHCDGVVVMLYWKCVVQLSTRFFIWYVTSYDFMKVFYKSVLTMADNNRGQGLSQCQPRYSCPPRLSILLQSFKDVKFKYEVLLIFVFTVTLTLTLTQFSPKLNPLQLLLVSTVIQNLKMIVRMRLYFKQYFNEFILKSSWKFKKQPQASLIYPVVPLFFASLPVYNTSVVLTR